MENPEDIHLSELKKNLISLEEAIDELHVPGQEIADPKGVGLREMAELPADWLDFIADGEEALELGAKEAREMEKLVQKLCAGVLNDAGEEADLERLILLKDRFEKIRNKH